MDDLATRCRTVATRLSKPHSEHIKDAAFDHLHEAATALAAKDAMITSVAEEGAREIAAKDAEIERLKEAGSLVYDEGVRRGIATERERCARVAERLYTKMNGLGIAAAIRAG